ncbi:MAG: hypothetical protein IPF51_08055, partial [Dehalococcoidia bacterium]|nr:hypothetical protein [Dehalococcoidia bacterium]
TVEKSNGVANGNKVDWTVTFHNSGPPATVDMSDSYQDAGTGTNLDNPNLTCTLLGADAVEDCEVAVGANGNTTVTLHTDRPAAKCEDQTVSNTVDAYFNGTRLGTTGNGRTGTYTEKGDESKCTVDIEICKVWRLSSGEGFANPVPRAFSFQVNAETPFNIENVFESGPAVCEIVTVPASGATIKETFPGAGWYTSHELNNDGETPVPMTNTAGGEGLSISLVFDGACYDTSVGSLVAEVTNLVRNIFSIQEAVAEGPLCTVTFYNEDPGQTLPTGDLRVEKYLDINGDGDANDPGEGPIDEWVVEVSGPEVNGQFPLSNNGTWDWLGLNSGDIYTVSELQQPGYQVTNTTVDGVSKGAVLFTFTKIPHGGTTVIRFYNQPLGGTIVAHKVAVTRHNAGPETAAPNDDDGWTITVSSAQCGINISKQTDANGNAVFAGLPLCTDYVVSENPVNASSPGFNPVSPVSVSGQTPNGQTITFKNRKDAEDPRCTVNCGPSTATPTTPTTPPTTVVPPTTTPVPPVIPPVTQVAGERTPGASATPIAPSTGGGIIGGATGGTNLVLIIAGILALTSGLSFVALGRKSRR